MRSHDSTKAAAPLPAPQPASWITKTPGVCGGEACIRNTRITVSGLVEWRSLGLSDPEVLEHLPDLTPDDLDEAWRYYEQHREEIDAIPVALRLRQMAELRHLGPGYRAVFLHIVQHHLLLLERLETAQAYVGGFVAQPAQAGFVLW